MQFELAKSTGSTAQDALRLGFQTTCNKGIATLLKVDDITIEECAAFKERHLEELTEYLDNIEEAHTKRLDSEFIDRMRLPYFREYNEKHSYIPLISWLCYIRLKHVWENTIPREHIVKVLSVEKTELCIITGKWTTKVNLEITKKPWCGYIRGNYNECVLEVNNESVYCTTNARKCTVNYTEYDDYHEKYIPDDAVEAAFQAKSIGMTGLKVASPVVKDTTNPPKDPIIVGFVGAQMFIIAWFGYDKVDHMSCNS